MKHFIILGSISDFSMGFFFNGELFSGTYRLGVSVISVYYVLVLSCSPTVLGGGPCSLLITTQGGRQLCPLIMCNA